MTWENLGRDIEEEFAANDPAERTRHAFDVAPAWTPPTTALGRVRRSLGQCGQCAIPSVTWLCRNCFDRRRFRVLSINAHLYTVCRVDRLATNGIPFPIWIDPAGHVLAYGLGKCRACARDRSRRTSASRGPAWWKEYRSKRKVGVTG